MSRKPKPAIGAQPGTLAIDPMASKPVIRVFCYDEDNIEEYEAASIDTVIDAYFSVVEETAERLESLEEWVLIEASPETPRKLSGMKDEPLKLRRAIAPQREELQALIRDDGWDGPVLLAQGVVWGQAIEDQEPCPQRNRM